LYEKISYGLPAFSRQPKGIATYLNPIKRLLLISLFSLVFSCQKKEEPTFQPELGYNLLIPEAHTWFEKEFKPLFSQGGRLGTHTPHKEPVWEKAIRSSQAGKDVIYIPLRYEGDHGSAKGERRRLMIFKDA